MLAEASLRVQVCAHSAIVAESIREKEDGTESRWKDHGLPSSRS